MKIFKRCGYDGCISNCKSQENNCIDYKNVELCDEYFPDEETEKVIKTKKFY